MVSSNQQQTPTMQFSHTKTSFDNMESTTEPLKSQNYQFHFILLSHAQIVCIKTSHSTLE